MLENGDFERETRLKNLRWIEDLIDNNSRIIIGKNPFIVYTLKPQATYFGLVYRVPSMGQIDFHNFFH
jgi:hypothetical protein